MILTILVFGTLALVVIGSALGMLLSRNTVYSALFLVLNFATVALLYLLLGAPFISLVQITVYAGAIMVLFLFVIMMLGSEKMVEDEPFRGQRGLAILLGLLFLLETGLVIVWQGSANTSPLAEMTTAFASPAEVGRQLFTTYALPFLVTGIILLAAVIGAVALPTGYRSRPKKSYQAQEKEE